MKKERKELKISKMWPKTLRFPLRLAWQQWQGLGLCYHDNVCPYIITAVTQSDLAHCPASTPPPPHPSLCLLALHNLLSRPLYSTLTDKNTGAQASGGALGLVGGECVPAHSDGLHKVFLRGQGREKSPPYHMVLSWCSRSAIFSDGWADRNMTPFLFPHALW